MNKFHFAFFLILVSKLLSAQTLSEYELKQQRICFKGASAEKDFQLFQKKLQAAHLNNYSDPDLASSFYKSADSLALPLKNKTLHFRLLLDYAFQRARQGDFELADSLLELEKNEQLLKESYFARFSFFRIMAWSNKVKGNLKDALENALEAKQILVDRNEKDLILASFNQMALVNIQSDIANLYSDTKQFEKSIQLHRENIQKINTWDEAFMLRVEKTIKDREQYLANTFNNLSLTLINQRDWKGINVRDTAIENFLEKIIALNKRTNNLNFLASNYYNYAVYFEGVKDNSGRKYYLEKALEINREMQSETGILNCSIELAEVLITEKSNLPKALKLATEAIKIVRDYPEWGSRGNVYLIYSRALSLNGKFEEATLYFDSAQTYMGEELKSTFDKEITEMQTKYETAEKEKEILKQNSEIKQRRSQAYILYGSLGAFAIIALLTYRSFLHKKKANELLEIKNQKITHQKKEITDSIDYSKRIQQSILPTKSLIKQLLPESFVLFQSKDIVSGDFYWMEKSKEDENLIYFAAVDCTGHGVPGALLSIMGYNILNQAVNDHGLSNPAKILEYLNSSLQSSIGKNTDTENLRDGMDIAFCSYHKLSLELNYAGAFNSLYHINNGSLTEYKADKIPIGAVASSTKKEFTNYSIQLSKGDCIYISTDGYADQFGGPDGKKFMKKQFKELLQNLSGLSMKDQKERLLVEFERWKGGLEQVDDILVMGLRA